MKLRKFYLISILIIGILTLFISGIDRVPVERVAVTSAVGYDIENSNGEGTLYSVPITIYNIDGQERTSKTYVAKAKSIGETRETRQLKIDRKFILGFEKVYIISEAMASYGIKEILDILIHNPQVNDTALMCVCSGKAEDIMKLKMSGYLSSGDFIEGLIKNSSEYSFYPKNYKLIDCYLRADSEGRNLVLPYITIKDGSIVITGLAVFNKEKLAFVAGQKESKILNLLKESNILGMLTI